MNWYVQLISDYMHKEIQSDRIAIHPAVRHGKPVIKGNRFPLEIIIGSLDGGMEIEETTAFAQA